MTKTALRALITVTAAGAVLLTASPALADQLPSGPETCTAGEDWDGEQCVARQLDEERIGRQTDGPNGEICTVIAVNPDRFSCVLPTPEPEVPSAPAPAPQPAPQAPTAAPAPVGPQQPAAQPPVRTAPQPASAPELGAPAGGAAVSPELQAVIQQILAMIRGWFAW